MKPPPTTAHDDETLSILEADATTDESAETEIDRRPTSTKTGAIMVPATATIPPRSPPARAQSRAIYMVAAALLMGALGAFMRWRSSPPVLTEAPARPAAAQPTAAEGPPSPVREPPSAARPVVPVHRDQREVPSASATSERSPLASASRERFIPPSPSSESAAPPSPAVSATSAPSPGLTGAASASASPKPAPAAKPGEREQPVRPKKRTDDSIYE